MKIYAALFAALIWLISGSIETTFAQNWYYFRHRSLMEPADCLTETSWILLNDSGKQRIVPIENNMDCSHQTIVNAKMSNIEIHDGNFRHCRLENVDLRQAIFVKCDFTNAVFVDPKVDENTEFEDCTFDNAEFYGYRNPSGCRVIPFMALRETRNFKDVDLCESIDCIPCRRGDSFAGMKIKGGFVGLVSEQLKETTNAIQREYNDLTLVGTKPDNLEGYDFSNSIIRNCKFRNFDLSSANFENAFLDNVQFVNCKMTLSQVETTWNYKNKRWNSLSFPGNIQRILDWETFRTTDLFSKKSVSSDFYPDKMYETREIDAKENAQSIIERMNKSIQDMDSSVFSVSLSTDRKLLYYNNVKEWDFRGFDLSNTNFLASIYEDAQFDDAVITNTGFLSHIWFDRSDKERFSRKQLESTKSYKEKSLTGIVFCDICDIRGVDFSNCDLSNTVFRTDITDVNFEDANITGAVFLMDSIFLASVGKGKQDIEELKRNFREQLKKTWNYKNHQMGSVVLPKELGFDEAQRSPE